MRANLHSNGWTTNAIINVIERYRPSTIRRDLRSVLGLKKIQASRKEKVMNIQWQPEIGKQGGAPLVDWLEKSVGSSITYSTVCDKDVITKFRQSFSKAHSKATRSRRVPITLQDKVEKEINKLVQKRPHQRIGRKFG